ncbi:MAG: phage replisome organizer N-terminal domain-containing protein [Patescibacteria group bacterium]|jgi:hypothetical protein
MGSRTWIKVYCDRWINGSIREETPELRSIWIDLMALVGSNLGADNGELRLAPGIGYTDEQISAILNIPVELWQRAKNRLIETERITVTRKNEIAILNWSKYQSEYKRQKHSRK